MKQGIYRNNLNSDSITVFYTFLFDIKRFEIYKDGLNSDFDKMFNFLFLYHIRGIANKEGVEYLENQINEQKNMP